MKFSIVIPSYNQHRFIAETFRNIRELKNEALKNNIEVEVLLFDNKSIEAVREIILENKDVLDYIDISADAGQYDAINKGINKLTGDYWTWLNTDDKIDVEGFFGLVEILRKDITVDYIYGDIEIIDEHSKYVRVAKATNLSLINLVNNDPGIYQPASFFKKSFTDKIGPLMNYRCCFDYEYVLRIIQNNGKLFRCDFTLAQFRLYKDSKSGSIVPVFIKEQLAISKMYGRKPTSRLGIISRLRLLKRRFIS